jgi:hypothetical protein
MLSRVVVLRFQQGAEKVVFVLDKLSTKGQSTFALNLLKGKRSVVQQPSGSKPPIAWPGAERDLPTGSNRAMVASARALYFARNKG